MTISATQYAADTIGQETGVDPVVILPLVIAVIELLQQCYSDPDEATREMRSGKPRVQAMFRIVFRRECIRLRIPRRDIPRLYESAIALVRESPTEMIRWLYYDQE